MPYRKSADAGKELNWWEYMDGTKYQDWQANKVAMMLTDIINQSDPLGIESAPMMPEPQMPPPELMLGQGGPF